MNKKRSKFLVIGAGTTGLILSHEIAKFGDVVLFETGEYRSADPTIDSQLNPALWQKATSEIPLTSRKVSAPQKALFNRCLDLPTGLGYGGSSNINAMIWTLGHPALYDLRWPKEWSSVEFEW